MPEITKQVIRVCRVLPDTIRFTFPDDLPRNTFISIISNIYAAVKQDPTYDFKNAGQYCDNTKRVFELLDGAATIFYQHSEEIIGNVISKNPECVFSNESPVSSAQHYGEITKHGKPTQRSQ